MMFAARKLQGIGLIMMLTICALFVYPISLRVSATRAELEQTQRDIASVRQQNRMLEGDIAVLANVRQLDQWNSEFLGYVAPSAGQYLSGERELASLDRLRPASGTRPGAPVLAAMQERAPAAAPQPAAADADSDGAGADAAAASARQMAMVDRRAVTASTVEDISRLMPVAATARSATR